MKTKIQLFALFSLIFTGFLSAQTPLQTPVNDISLMIDGEYGNNGLGVAYDKFKNIYYTVFAGNASYPIEVHDAKGKSISSSEIGADLRGFWLNPSSGNLEGILYDNAGSCSFKLNQYGFPTGIEIDNFSYGMEGNDVTCFNNGKVYFITYDGIKVFKKGKKKGKVIKNSQVFLDNNVYNPKSIFHTGIKGFELGVYNHADSKVVLINEKSGKIVSEISIPFLDHNYEDLENFNVGFANNHFFLFSKNDRTWFGFKIF